MKTYIATLLGIMISLNAAAMTPPPPPPPTISVAQDYYLVEAGYTCTPMAMFQGTQAQPIASWKNKITVEGNDAIIAGDACNDALQVISSDALEISSDGSSLTYQGQHYEYMANPPL